VRILVEPSTPAIRPPARTVPGVGPVADSIDGKFLRLTSLALFVCLGTDVFGGVIRFVLVKAGAPFLSYLPMLLTAALLGAYFLYLCTVSRLDRRTCAVLAFFVAYFFYSLLTAYSLPKFQDLVGLGRVAFALYTWTPFFLGMVLADQRAEATLRRYAPLWWALAVVGVCFNRVVHFPWTGSSFEVLGQESQVARSWSTNGLERLAGFSRASYTAANEIAILGILLASNPKLHRIVRVLVWILSAVGIVLTTSKTPLATLLVVPPALWILGVFPTSKGPEGDSRYHVAIAILLALMAAMVALPAASSTQDLLVKYSFRSGGFLTFSSMLDRTAIMWPAAFGLIPSDQNRIEWVFGRGLGGIGSAQTIFESAFANSADNMFVFLYVTFGVACVVFALMMLSGLYAVYREAPVRFDFFFALAASVLTLGMASNVIESLVPAIALGMLAGKSGRPDSGPSQLRRPARTSGATTALSLHPSRQPRS
jgi:hypothetical protein